MFPNNCVNYQTTVQGRQMYSSNSSTVALINLSFQKFFNLVKVVPCAANFEFCLLILKFIRILIPPLIWLSISNQFNIQHLLSEWEENCFFQLYPCLLFISSSWCQRRSYIQGYKESNSLMKTSRQYSCRKVSLAIQ